jgi:hypothetical protein
VAHEVGQLLDRAVDRRAAAGERGAVALDRGALVRAHARVEGVEEVVQLDRLERLRERQRRTRLQLPARAPARELDELQAERGARPDGQGGVRRQRLDRLVELHRQHRDRAPVALLGDPGRDLVDDAGAEASEPDLVADDEVGAARDLGAEVVGGDERQPRVRAHREQHRHHRDEHGHRPDQDGARDDRCGRAADHGASR